MKQLLVLFGYLAVLASLGASQESALVIQVNCPDAVGCFRLLGQAIESAPEGATIQLGSGIFYELPIVISKSLTIRGTRDASQPQIIATTINAVQSGALITMRNSDHPLSAILEDLRIQSNGRGFNIEGAADGVATQLTVTIRDSALLTGDVAIDVHGKTQLTLLDNRIQPDQSALSAEDGKLTAEGNTFIRDSFGEPPAAMLILKDVEADFRKNRISQGPTVRRTVGIMVLGGRYSFIENQIVENLAGILIGGATTADFQKNLFDNNQLGILLNTPPCVQDPAPEIRFDGFITGSDNQFLYNSTADLCPALTEFPWPEGFVKP